MRSNQALARIRLNLTNVDQFLAIACSIADYNNQEQLKQSVFEAAKEIRSSAILIDHLRNLFNHQELIKCAAEEQRCQVTGQLCHYLSSTSSNNNSKPDDNKAAAQITTQLLFTYSNQVTLIKAAKCLIANVAKVLYLTNCALNLSDQEEEEADEKSSNQQRHFRPVKPGLSIVGDNAANYSQLLRSFSELSSDLVDLGQCIWLSGHRQPQTIGECCFNPTYGNCMGSYDHQQQTVSIRPSDVAASSSCWMQQPSGHGQLLDQAEADQLRLEMGADSLWLAEGRLEAKPLASGQEVQIQDMQTLFQVNRLIIDRFIILLLSASKCCLRLGEQEFHVGLKVRKSILLQIRASISIIMAIVKYTVFSEVPATENCLSAVPATALNLQINHRLAPQQPLLPLTDLTNRGNNQRLPDYSGHYEPELAENCDSHSSNNNNNNNNDNNNNKPAWQLEAAGDYFLPYNYCKVNNFYNNLLVNNCNDSSGNNKIVDGKRAPATSKTTPAAANADCRRDVGGELEIMSYFLKTWNGTHNAQDAMSRIQTLIGPFKTIINYKHLMQTLNDTFRTHQASALINSDGLQQAKRNAEHENGGNDKENNVDMSKVNSHNIMLLNKRQLVNVLNTIFLGDIRNEFIDRIYEFTDCPYTNHEHRELILQLLQCIKIQLNKLVKTLYRLRRKTSAINEISLAELRNLAIQIDETCFELKYELQTVVIEQSDELDRSNSQLNLIKQLKHYCLVGDYERTLQLSLIFQEQTEQLVEICKTLNQISPTHKMKITTKSLAIWFELNLPQLLENFKFLSQNPRSKILKDCTWSYVHVWCSFYDDFCQSARQVAYLTHAQYDPERSARVLAIREQIVSRRQFGLDLYHRHGDEEQQENFDLSSRGTLFNATSVQSLNLLQYDQESENAARLMTRSQGANYHHQPSYGLDEESDSPRSLDHYYGFGTNYHHRLARVNGTASEQLTYHRAEPSDYLIQSQPPQQSLETSFPFNNNKYQPYGAGQQQQPDQLAPLPVVSVSEQLDQEEIIRPPPPPPLTSRRKHMLPEPLKTVTIREDAAIEEGRRARSASRRQVEPTVDEEEEEEDSTVEEVAGQRQGVKTASGIGADSASKDPDQDKWSGDSDADAIVRGAKETAQMALSMYQFTKGEGDLNTTQDLFTQAELFAEEANELYKEVRCFSYKVPAGDLKRELLNELGTIPALVQQLQFIVKNPTVGKPATFAKVDSVIRETRSLMEAVNRVVTATLACRQHYNMAINSMRKRTRTLSPSYHGDKGFEFSEQHLSANGRQFGGRPSNGSSGAMGSEPDI